MPTAEDCERNKKIVILAAYHCYLRCGIEKTTQVYSAEHFAMKYFVEKMCLVRIALCGVTADR